MKRSWISGLVLAAVIVVLGAGPAQGFTRLDGHHVDLGVGGSVQGGQWAWDPLVHSYLPFPAGTFYAPLDAGQDAWGNQRSLPAYWGGTGSAYGSVLFATGNDYVYHLDQNSRSGELWLGLTTEYISPVSAFTGPITWELVGLDHTGAAGGPAGHVYAFTYSGSGPNMYFDSDDGLGGDDAFGLGAGSHAHLNWVFTQPGIYELTIRFSGSLDPSLGVTPLAQSVEATYRYMVETLDGDANLDGVVNASDYATVLGSYLQTGGGWLGGDFNFDNSVNATDYAALLGGYLQTTWTFDQQAPPAPAVPEPSVLIGFMSLAGLCLVRRSNGGRRHTKEDAR